MKMRFFMLQGAWSMEQVAGAPRPRARGATASILGSSLLKEHTEQVTPVPPRDVTRRTGEQIDGLLDDSEIKPEEIRAALGLLRAKPNLGPGVLPNLVNEVRQKAAHPELAGIPQRERGRPQTAGHRRHVRRRYGTSPHPTERQTHDAQETAISPPREGGVPAAGHRQVHPRRLG